jgi:lipopolysaccharide transport system ATP-binding protein
MGPVIIRAEHLGKRYRIGSNGRRGDTAREALSNAVRNLLRPIRRPAPSRELWALDDVSFEIHSGETVGIIGRNGAGKSTLLKVLSQITEPTTGFVDLTGRVGSLLEVGTGFHADLSGRENTYLNGAILGMSKAEIDGKFDEIVAFAEVDAFIDTPVKHYSSGMYMRLAFAVAAHLQTEILVVDEVLAVGDAQFQKKCLGKMDDIARHGRTVLFISHSMEAIQRLCMRGMLLDRGKLIASGPTADVVAQYRSVERRVADTGRFNPQSRSGSGCARVTDMALVDGLGRRTPSCAAEDDLVFELNLELEGGAVGGASLRGLVVELVICSDHGQPLVSLMNVDDGGVALPGVKTLRLTSRLAAPTFIPGHYRVNVFLGIPYLEHVDEIPEAFEFEILPPNRPWRPYELHATRGITCRKAAWTCAVPQSETV